jgi:hypothetical protein
MPLGGASPSPAAAAQIVSPLPAGHEVIIQQEGGLHPRHRRGQPGRVDAIEPGQSDYANGNAPFAEKLISTISGAARQYPKCPRNRAPRLTFLATSARKPNRFVLHDGLLKPG